MFNQFKNLLFSDTGRDTTIVFIGTLINLGAGGLFFILAARILLPADYGIFTTVVATGAMAVAVANFGLDTGILRFAKKDSDQLNKILSLAFKTYLMLGLITGLLGFLISPFLAQFLGQPAINQLLRIAFGSTILMLLSNFFVAGLQAKQQFLKATIINLSSNLARLLVLLIGFYLATINLYFLTTLFFSVVIVSVVMGKVFLPFNFAKTPNDLIGNFFKYNFWVAAALIISSIPFDNYFLLKLAGPVQTGLYSAPFKLLTFAYQFGGNFTRVLASRFASFDTNKKVCDFALRATLFPIMLTTGLLVLIIMAPTFVFWLFGSQYAAASNVLRILSFGFIFFFAATIPSSIILYYLGQSTVSFVITALRYLLFVILLSLLVPSQKAIGGAIAFSLSELFSFLLMTTYLVFKLKISPPTK